MGIKKVLIIAQRMLPDIGGIEKYIDNLINLFSLENLKINIYITEIVSSKYEKEYKKKYPNVNIIYAKYIKNNNFHFLNNVFFKNFFNIINKKIAFGKFYKKKNYDLIIDNTFFNFRELRKDKKVYYVQHNSPEIFIKKKIKLFFLINPKKFILVLRDKILKTSLSWIYYTNIILYSEKDKIIFEKHRKFSNWQNVFFCLCCIRKYDIEYNYNSRGNIISILRYENEQKNLTFMDEVSKNLDNPINVYGEGDDKDLFQNTIVHDKITEENLKYNILSKSSLYIMTSNFEGFGFAIVEALSMGLPIIIRDTFPHATTLVKDKYNGLVFDKNATPVEVANGIKELLKNPKLLNDMSKNSIKIFEENFEISNFNKSWEHIIKQILNK
ncbi:MAG: glycosyltransferase [Mycoplasmoidaceae bacterium]